MRSGPHPATVGEYLESNGLAPPIEKGRTAEADLAIQTQGSFFAYDRKGGVTVVDPARGKVYYFRAR